MMISFRRKPNWLKRTQWWDTNRPRRIYNRHYTEISPSIPNHYPLQFFFSLLFVRPVHSVISYLLQFFSLTSYPKLINTIVTNVPLCSVNIDLMHSHKPPLTEVVQAWCASLHLTITSKAPQISRDKKSGKNIPYLGLPVSSIVAAILWLLWLKKSFLKR